MQAHCLNDLFLPGFVASTIWLPTEWHHPCVWTPVERDGVVGFKQFCTIFPQHIWWSANLFKCRTNWHACHTWRYWQTIGPELQLQNSRRKFSNLPTLCSATYVGRERDTARVCCWSPAVQNRSISPAAGRSAANPPQQQCGRQMKGQTERRTYERYIDPALHSSQ